MAANEMHWRNKGQGDADSTFLSCIVGEVVVYGGITGIEFLDDENLLPSVEIPTLEADCDFDEAALESWFWHAAANLSGSLW